MRTTFKVCAFLIAAATTGNAAGSEPSGNGIALNGADTLFNVTQELLIDCQTKFPDFVTAGLSYLGGGSGLGAAQMRVDAQRIAPMVRPLRNSEFCGADQSTTEALAVGLMSVAVLANQATTCGFGAGGDPNLLPASANGVAADSLAVLRLLYFGLQADGTFDCNGTARHNLVSQWSNLFTTNCASGDVTCGSGLRHALRGPDLSEVTSAFVSLIGAGNRAIGDASGQPLAAAKRQNPFCNSQDANPATAPSCGATTLCPAGFACDKPTDPANAGHCILSEGGVSDYADVDPIRIPCSSTEAVCQPSTGLGLVLPVAFPGGFSDGTAFVTASLGDVYPQVPCDGSCDLVAVSPRPLPPNFRCPDGQIPPIGRCWLPRHTDLATGIVTFKCQSKRSTRCFGVSSPFDGRSYNKPYIRPQANLPAAFAVDNQNHMMNAVYFRVHESPSDPAPCSHNLDFQSQMGCLTESDPCTMGYALRAAAPPQKELGVNGLFPDQLLGFADGGPAKYPLAQRLYLATLKGFSAVSGGEHELEQCCNDPTLMSAALMHNGLDPMPGGPRCLDYDESPDTAAGVITTTKIGTGGCSGVPSGGNVNACAVSPP
jgi:hypothetical protein